MPVDLSGQHFGLFQKALERAKKLEAAGDFPRAAVAYRECHSHYLNYAKFGTEAVKAERLKTAQQYQSYAETLAKRKPGVAALPEEENKGGAEGSNELRTTILSLIERSQIGWDDIGGLEETKQEIKLAYGLALAKRPVGVKLRGWRNFLFYGPPGTGKSRLAAATSSSLEATFFNVRVSALLSKFFGESSKLITELYTVAREMAPAVVFIDELESLTPSRGGDESGAERRILSTLLVELQGLSQQGEGAPFVVTIGATNVPWLMDEAILSRFERKIYVPLPDLAAREEILRIHLAGFPLAGGVSYREIGGKLEGFSGREIEQFCGRVTGQIIREMNPGLSSAVDKGKAAVEQYTLKVRPATSEDFEEIVAKVKPGASPAYLDKLGHWRSRVEG
ncbi:MAG: ATP-binding protein [Chloroflexi bacterium]|uniref:ATP-binding protein n=1 Tax=Candidatus Chlorohelix allophototropha TaxID=3003348 RepID=A0A8T7M488_9CHLR|nr:ATP-binding protein [Chloroflexota bacterium]WJW70107.1 ATP-binding protein [Chloroflexota bacterium L227-S17]